MSMEIDGKLIVDTMFSESRGTFRAASTEKTAKRLKLKVNGVYYDLSGERAFEVFPLTSGSGRYTVALYRQVEGKRYARVGLVRFSVRLQREDAAFLSPSQWVMYDGLSPWILAAHQMCDGLQGSDAFNAICRLVEKNIRYDYIRALKAKPGERPDIERCWDIGVGTCQDIAALAASMMRARGIPARLVIGKAGRKAHAWVEALIDGHWKVYDPTAAITGGKAAKYQKERVY
jgi:transglutaminase-like putative cysteine protease